MNKQRYSAWKTALLMVLMFSFSSINAQLNLLQQKTFGQPFVAEEGEGIAALPNGGIVTATRIFNAGPGPLGGTFGEVKAYDADGNLSWETTIGGPRADVPLDLLIDNNGDIIISGQSNSSPFDNLNADGWILKLDAAGNVLWERFFGGAKDDRFDHVNLTSDGGYLAVGDTRSNDRDIPAGLSSGSNSGAVWAAKIDTDGNLEWSEIFYGQGVFVSGSDGLQTADGGYLIGGSAFGQGGDIPDSNGDFDYWLIKLDAQRNIQWSKVYGGIGPELMESLSAMPGGGFLMSGYSNSQPSGDVSMHFAANDYWVVRVDDSGNIIWEKSLGGQQPDFLNEAIVTPDGNIFAVGASSSTTGTVSENYGGNDIWVVNLDANGMLLAEKNFGGSAAEFPKGIALSPNGIYIAASTSSDDFDVVGYNGDGSRDAWFIEIGSGGGTGGGDIDLSLSMTATPADPSIYSNVEIGLTVTNDGPATAMGIEVVFPKPADVVYTGGNEWTATQGSFIPFGNEQWTVGSLAPGASATLTVSYFMLTEDPVTAYAQVTAAIGNDMDSTPGNGSCCSPNEDDEASVTLNGGTSVCDLFTIVTNINCDNNGTFNNPFDDTFSFNLVVNNGGASGSYNVLVLETNEQIFGAPYSIGLQPSEIPISAGEATLQIEDAAIPGCSTILTVPAPLPCSGQPLVCPGDITLSSQAEVDAWPDCFIVEGNLTISGNDITDLGPLSILQKVRGLLSIESNDVLTNLNGLENLDSAGVLFIINNTALNDLSGLNNLTQTEIVSLIIDDNSSLTDINSLNNFVSTGFLNIMGNTALQAISGFNNLQSTGGLLQIADNPVLTDLSGFSSLETINQNLQIINNDALTTINGFGNLSTVTDIFVLSGNDQLENIDGFNSLSDLNSLVIVGHSSLQQIDALATLTTISGNLDIRGNNVLSDCCGIFPLLNANGVSGSIFIENNPMFCASEQEILNNCQPGGDIDLELTLVQSTNAPVIYSNYQITATLTNNGPQTATGVSVSFKKPNGVVYTGGNEFDASQGTFNPFGNEEWNVGSIPAGGSATLEVSYFLLQNVAPDAYAQVSTANEQDGDSTPGNGTPPSVNEDDEASTSSSPPMLEPDLTLANLNIQNSPIDAGQVLNYQFDASNAGNGPATGNFTIKAYISTDNVLSANDIQDGMVPTGNYGAGQSFPGIPGASVIPSNLTSGQYFLILKIDADEDVAESNEGNNVLSALFTVAGSDPGSACSFTTQFTPSNFDPLELNRDLDLQETTNGYSVFHSNTRVNPAFPPTSFDTYELDLAGNVQDAFQSPVNIIYDVAVETDADDNVTMVFLLSPDLPAGTEVPIDIDYPNPTEVIHNSKAVKTSTGYAFGIGIVDLSQVPIIINRVITTDNFGQNVSIFELPTPEFFSGFSRLLEGPDGSLFTEWRASGNYSLFTIPANAAAQWQVKVAADTPSTTWVETEAGPNGNFVYTMKTDNLQTFVAKYRVATGQMVGLDLSELKASADPSGFRQTFAGGIEATPDDGLLVSLAAREVLGGLPDFQVLAKYDAVGNLEWKLEIPDPPFGLVPAGATSDGGALFAGRSGIGIFPVQTIFLKTTADGLLTPLCSGGSNSGVDLELDMNSANPNPPIYSSTEITLTVNNTGTEPATGVVIDFPRPAGTVYTGGNEWDATQGSFNPFGNEQWTVGTVPAGGTASITVSYFLLSADALTPYAQVLAMNETDNDSSPGNGVCCTPTEDDEATISINDFAGGGGSNQLQIPNNRFRLAFDLFYPNPAAHWLNIEMYSPEETEGSIEFYDQTGKQVHRMDVHFKKGKNNFEIYVHDWRSGFYNVIGRSEGLPAYGRFVKAWE